MPPGATGALRHSGTLGLVLSIIDGEGVESKLGKIGPVQNGAVEAGHSIELGLVLSIMAVDGQERTSDKGMVSARVAKLIA